MGTADGNLRTLSPRAFQLWTGRCLSMFQMLPEDVFWPRPSAFCRECFRPEPGVSLLVDVPSFFWPGIMSESSFDHTCRLPTRGFLILPAS